MPAEVLRRLGLPQEPSNGTRPRVRRCELEEYCFEFNPNGDPYTGLLAATLEGSGTYTAEVNLAKPGSRGGYAKEAAELYGMDAARLKRALN